MIEPMIGFVYLIRINDGPDEYRAMCLQSPAAGSRPTWYVYDGPNGPLLLLNQRINIVGVDGEHMGNVGRAVALVAEQAAELINAVAEHGLLSGPVPGGDS
jgi:hypothetical protein